MSQSVMDERQLSSPRFGFGMAQPAIQQGGGGVPKCGQYLQRVSTSSVSGRMFAAGGGRQAADGVGGRQASGYAAGGYANSPKVHGNVCGRGRDGGREVGTSASNGTLVWRKLAVGASNAQLVEVVGAVLEGPSSACESEEGRASNSAGGVHGGLLGLSCRNKQRCSSHYPHGGHHGYSNGAGRATRWDHVVTGNGTGRAVVAIENGREERSRFATGRWRGRWGLGRRWKRPREPWRCVRVRRWW